MGTEEIGVHLSSMSVYQSADSSKKRDNFQENFAISFQIDINW